VEVFIVVPGAAVLADAVHDDVHMLAVGITMGDDEGHR